MRTTAELITTIAQKKTAGETEEAHRAFDALFAMTAGRIRSQLAGYFKHAPNAENLADDAVTSGLLRVYLQCEKFVPQEDATGWLFMICKNRMIDLLRLQKSDQRIFNYTTDFAGLTDPHLNPAEFHAAGDEWIKLQTLIDALPEKRRITATLSMIEGKKMTEIAEKTGEKINTINQRLIRERREIVQKMDLNHVQCVPSVDEKTKKEPPALRDLSPEMLKQRIDFTPQEISLHSRMTTAEIRERYGCSRITAWRIKNGRTFYEGAYHERDIVNNEQRAAEAGEDIGASAERAVNNTVKSLRSMLSREGVQEQLIEGILSSVNLSAARDRAAGRLRELAGHERFGEARWRNQVAYHAARRYIEAAVREVLITL